VFSALYNGWKEYQNFVADLQEDKVKKAIDVLKKEIIQQQKQKRYCRVHSLIKLLKRHCCVHSLVLVLIRVFFPCREKEENERLEEERKKMRVPRFETAEEREQRMRTERELVEFGPATIEFRLSSPNPS